MQGAFICSKRFYPSLLTPGFEPASAQPEGEVPGPLPSRPLCPPSDAFQTKGAWIPYSLRNCDSLITEYTVEYPSSGLLEARLHVKIWQDEEMEAPMSLNSDPLPPTLRSKLKEAAEGYSYRTVLYATTCGNCVPGGSRNTTCPHLH